MIDQLFILFRRFDCGSASGRLTLATEGCLTKESSMRCFHCIGSSTALSATAQASAYPPGVQECGRVRSADPTALVDGKSSQQFGTV